MASQTITVFPGDELTIVVSGGQALEPAATDQPIAGDATGTATPVAEPGVTESEEAPQSVGAPSTDETEAASQAPAAPEEGTAAG